MNITTATEHIRILIDIEDIFYDYCKGAQLKFAWTPKYCARSNKRIWLKFGYKLTAIFTGPGTPVYEHRWHDKDEHLIWILTK